MGLQGDEETKMMRRKSSIFRYNSPLVQVTLIGLVCFCCPGMFNALSGMGGGGQVDPTAANNANTAHYTTFAVFGILGGGIYNILGPRATLFAGCSTYVLYAGSFLYYNHYHHQPFALTAGALLGVGAGLLWAGQGAIMTAYPPADRKGTYISLFWTIFNMGGVIGGLIPCILNYHRGATTAAASVNDATYIGFMIFMSVGTLLSLAILHPSRIIRNDSSLCTNIKYSSISVKSTEILKLFLNWRMLLLSPAAWASNFVHCYQFNNANGVLFDLRTRGLTNMCYWTAQMIGSLVIGYIIDFSFKSRRVRGLVSVEIVGWDWNLGPLVLYFAYGLLDAMFQSTVYWLMDALADDSETLSRYTGFYKGVQSAGAAVAWQIDTHKVPFLAEMITNWSLTTLSYPLLAVLVVLAVEDDNQTDQERTF
ncbi:hypothetical protein ACSBR1_026403 [Camellia fascicularis]